MNSAPKDVKGTPVLQYELEKKSGYDERHNITVNEKRVAKLRQDDAFRTLMPKATWDPRGNAPMVREGAHFSHIYGQDVVGIDGTAVSVRNALPVPIGSRDVVVPRELKPGHPIRDGRQSRAETLRYRLAGLPGGRRLVDASGSGHQAERRARLFGSHGGATHHWHRCLPKVFGPVP